jgi:hypothetical protein
MEMFIYFKSLGRYFCESPEHIREELVNELRERLHRREQDIRLCNANENEDSNEGINTLARLIVRDPNAPSSVLSRLAGTKDKEVLERIAEHPRVSVFTLTELSRSEHHEVRVAVADNAATPTNVLHQLVEDEHVDVRYRLAENPHICVSVLLRLEEDENPYVSMRAGLTLERLDFGYRSLSVA